MGLEKLSAGKRNNVIMQFSSDEEDGEEVVEEGEVQSKEEEPQVTNPPGTDRTAGEGDTPRVQILKKNNFLLAFSDD